MLVKKVTLFVLFIVHAIIVHSTHNRAAEITFEHISGYTYKFTLVTYTYTPSLADRPQLDLHWGDGSSSTLPRIEETDLGNDITHNVYKGIHTYQAPGTYKVSMEDPNRNYGIINIPNSVNVCMFVETTIVVSPFLGPNNSPQFTFPPIDIGCVGQPFYHNPGAYDPDNSDSIAFELIYCRGCRDENGNGSTIVGYSYPSASDSFEINPITGTLSWVNPIMQGEYNVAILIKEYRKGILISAITRDMQINIIPCNNQSPEISTINDTCVTAGELLNFTVYGSDANNDYLTLSANGAPFQVSESPAQFPQVSGYPVIEGEFNWQTNCSHVRKLPYLTYFKLEDYNYEVNLIDIHTMFITVVCPAPENLTATALGTSIHLKWNKVVCENASKYKIYRRIGSYGFIPAHCETGVPAYTGYSYIAQTNSVNDTTFIDNNNGIGLSQGPEYCYMVIAYFDDGAESYASNEACASLKLDVPVITNVSVRETDEINGSMFVKWTTPYELDTIVYPGPYKYKVFRGEGFNPFNYTLIETYFDIQDTTFIDTLLNTKENPYTYIIEMWNDDGTEELLIGKTVRASSVYLNIGSYDATLFLHWDFQVPWLNESYTVYRYNELTQEYDSIGVSNENSYIDTGLENGIEYCYLIRSSGSYYTDGLPDPLINFSQISCQIPIDTVPPCTPVLTVEPDCEVPGNELYWTNPIFNCNYSDDLDHYNIYYSNTESGYLSIVFTEYDPYATSYFHFPGNTVAGCYAISAVDSVGNESSLSDTICVDIDVCDLYILPNVFTPNGDGINDFWHPFPYDFVESINISVFNRWGNIVFETQNPDVNWDGKHEQIGMDCSEGVYFYVCEVSEIRLSGLINRTITGSVTIIRNPGFPSIY